MSAQIPLQRRGTDLTKPLAGEGALPLVDDHDVTPQTSAQRCQRAYLAAFVHRFQEINEGLHRLESKRFDRCSHDEQAILYIEYAPKLSQYNDDLWDCVEAMQGAEPVAPEFSEEMMSGWSEVAQAVVQIIQRQTQWQQLWYDALPPQEQVRIVELTRSYIEPPAMQRDDSLPTRADLDEAHQLVAEWLPDWGEPVFNISRPARRGELRAFREILPKPW
ncbi:hypothetical protein LTR09_011865 [Extremus antarcticus]|uniref:Uncharacterized protein n=1 Tax=Extremus antarcticus TaxID=702011 RepID=A0AAJ0D5P2_9PEZI|nr:hypothetical protein LTR09_011865 [Extremus antarcticus]